ncbi:MAG: hypothetical protein ABIH66_03380, partial [bacterium]
PISGGPNLSGFPGDSMSCAGSTNMKCIYVTITPDTCYPAFPTVNVPTPDDEGGKCTLTWTKVSTNSNPTTPGCESFKIDPLTGQLMSPPDPADIVGYEIIMKEDPTGTCANIPFPTDTTPEQIPNSGNNKVLVTATHEITVTGLWNDRTYCFLPFSVDGSENYPSPSTLPNGKPCTPKRLMPPAEPVISTIDKDNEALTCTPRWNAVSDPDPIKYNVYRCDDEKTACAEANFVLLAAGTNLPGTTLQLTDSLDDAMTYTYAITAEEPGGIESAIVGTNNLGECNLGSVCGNGTVEPGEDCDPPGAECSSTCKTIVIIGDDEPPATANAAAIAANSGCKFWFTASPSDTDTGTFETNEGYKIYLCTGTTADTCEDTPISTRSACADAAAAGGIIQDICDNSQEPYNQFGLLSAGKEGTWYAGITYTNSTNVESDKKMSSSSSSPSCLVTACTSPLVDITITAQYEINTDTGGAFTQSENQDLTIEVVNQDTDALIAAGATGEDGTATIEVCPTNLAGKTIRVQIRIPEATATGMPCDDTASDCLLYLKPDISGNDMVTGYDVTKSVALPKEGPLAGRKQIGNADCNNIVDSADFMELRGSYKYSAGDDEYRAWADFNNDGTVDSADFMILRNNYKKEVFGKDADYVYTVDDAGFCLPPGE